MIVSVPFKNYLTHWTAFKPTKGTGHSSMDENTGNAGNDLERLIKLLKKTQGSNDHESLMAIRMTNSFLEKKSWDWESLLRGKIKVIADPFSMVAPPPKPKAPPTPAPTRAQQDAAQQAAALRDIRAAQDKAMRDAQAQAAAQTAYQKGAWSQSSNASRPNPFQASSNPQTQSAPLPRVSPLRANKYPGNCWQCGYFVDRNAGHIFQAGTLSTTSWEILCVPCEAASKGGTRQLSSIRAIRKNGPSPAATPSVDQL